MTKPMNLPDKQRRRVIQGAALSTAAMAVPGLANAICGSGGHELATAKQPNNVEPMLNNDDVAIELVETDYTVRSGKLARVTITNKSAHPIKLSHVSPGTVSTQKGVYQINATLSNNPLSIRSGGVYQFWLTPDNGTQALRSTKPKRIAGDGVRSTMLEVSVRTHLDSGPWTGTQRVQALIA